MFNAWGRIVATRKVLVLAIAVIAMFAIAGAGSLFGKPFTQGGFEDPDSGWAAAESAEVEAYGRDALGDVVVLYHAPGGNVDDQQFLDNVADSLSTLREDHPDEITGITSYTDKKTPALVNRDEGIAVASIQIAGSDDEILENYRQFEDEIPVDGIETQIGGLQPVAGALDKGMTNDLKRAELIALPLVFLLLIVVFGGVVAALLPVAVGILTIISALGLLQLMGIVHPVNSFANNVVTLIGLGLAIDYGLFVVSRFREEMAAGYRPPDAARRSVATAGRTVAFSALMVGATLSGLLIFPQEFLKSVSYGAIAAVVLAALLSVTALPALLAILGHRVDFLSVRGILGRIVPALRRDEADDHAIAPGEEKGFFARIARFAMSKPWAVAVPIVVVLLALIAPFFGVKFGGINETYLPPDNPTRVAQETYDEAFPQSRTDPVKLVIVGGEAQQVSDIRQSANQAPGLTGTFQFAKSGEKNAEGQDVTVLQASVADRNSAKETVEYLQKFPIPDGTTVYVGGNPAMEQDSIHALVDGLPFFAIYVLVITTLLLFLAFGSLVLPFKAALMNALGLGATLGVLTWIFVDGHGASALGFTAGPLTSPVVVLLVAIIYGLSTDYEVFLLSRMVEARSRGVSTEVAIRSGIARTGQIITSAALILIVVTGAFAFSEIVMMKYIAFGMIAALIIDATVIRMLLVPAVMKLLGEDCWWAPRWMKKVQHRIGLGEAELDHEEHLREPVSVGAAGASASAGAGATAAGGAAGAVGAGAAGAVGAGSAGSESVSEHESPASVDADADDSWKSDAGHAGSGKPEAETAHGREADRGHDREAERDHESARDIEHDRDRDHEHEHDRETEHEHDRETGRERVPASTEQREDGEELVSEHEAESDVESESEPESGSDAVSDATQESESDAESDGAQESESGA
ncbi:MMPL family transporter, partial [Dietzia sp.]|uniref:MMPL family transporter n=1 Tax=Dietzia sp. TaxID=1871616 RepID=UPI002FD96067